MRNRILLSVLMVTLITIAKAQAPQQLNFQGIARKAAGEPITYQNISVRLSVLDSANGGQVAYTETRSVMTNYVGLFNIVIGSNGATNVSGAMGSVNWASGKKYIKLEIDPNGRNSYTLAGITQLQSVAYALSATPSGNAGGDLTGFYPSPVITNSAVTTSKIADGSVTLAKLSPDVAAVLSTNVTAQLAAKLNVSDTAAMLSTYAGKAATNAALATKLKIADTALMLNPYASKASTNAGLATKLNIADTAAMLSGYLTSANVSTKLNIADTAAMLTPYASKTSTNAGLATKLNIADTSAMLSGYLTSANVSNKLNIADTAAMLSGYLTSANVSNKLNVSDTAAMLSGYLTSANVSNKLNVSDTAAMLSGYLTSANVSNKLNVSDTAAMLSGYLTSANISNKLNVSDTAAMLSGYLTSANVSNKLNVSDTAAMLSGYLTSANVSNKLNVSDTAAMLNPYASKTSTIAGLATKLNIADTAAMLSGYLTSANVSNKLNVSDTAAMLNPYASKTSTIAGLATKLNVADTAAMLSGYLTSANVSNKLNVSDTAAMLSGYLTSANVSNKLNVSDTAAMLNPYASKTSTIAGLATKLNIADTAAMLSGYLTSANVSNKLNVSDTAAMLNPYASKTSTIVGLATKLNIADTAAMLSGYLTSANVSNKLNVSDTAAMLNPYASKTSTIAGLATKLNIADTAAMLSGYLTSANVSNKLNVSDTAAMLNPYASKTSTIAGLAAKLNVSDTAAMLGSYVTAIGSALNYKENTINKSTDINLGTSDVLFPSQKAVKTYIDTHVSGSPTPNATTTLTGTIQLSGDLGGTGTNAMSPVISDAAITTIKLADYAVNTNKILDAAVTDAKIATVSGTKVTGNIPGKALNVTGVVAVANGGTGLSSLGSASQQIRVNAGGTQLEYFTPTAGSGGGMSTLNGVAAADQSFETGNTGGDFNISSAGSIHTFSIPDAGPTARGLITPNSQSIGGNKTFTDNFQLNSELRLASPGGTIKWQLFPSGDDLVFHESSPADVDQLTIRSGGNLSGAGNADFGGTVSAGTLTAGGNITAGADATITGEVKANSFSTYLGSSTDFLKADGTLDGNTYVTASDVYSSYLSLVDGGTLLAPLTGTTATFNQLVAGTVTYPTADGATGQVLTTNGSGTAAWVSAAPMEVADELTASVAQTSFSLSKAPSVNSKVKMYINGKRISNTAYTVAGSTLSYNAANNGSYVLTATDMVQFDYYY